MINPETQTLEFCIEDLGYPNETLETKAIVMSKVLKDLGLPYKRYYITEGCKQTKKPKISPPDMTIAFAVTCNGDYLAFAWYNYRKRMNAVISMQKSFNSETNVPCK